MENENHYQLIVADHTQFNLERQTKNEKFFSIQLEDTVDIVCLSNYLTIKQNWGTVRAIIYFVFL